MNVRSIYGVLNMLLRFSRLENKQNIIWMLCNIVTLSKSQQGSTQVRLFKRVCDLFPEQMKTS